MRKWLFISVCIPLRIAYAAIVGWLIYTQVVYFTYGFIVVEFLIGLAFLKRGLAAPLQVWWPRVVHTAIAWIAVVFAGLTTQEVAPKWSVSLILCVDVLIGIAYAIKDRPFQKPRRGADLEMINLTE